MRHLFIINPISGGKRHDPQQTERMIKIAMSNTDEDYEIYFTKAPRDACRKIEEEVAKYDDLRVYACGGDGTLNECVNGVAGHPNAAVTQIPCGTGNDFLKVFSEDIPRFRDVKELVFGETHKIDMIKCNDWYCINIASVGIDARVGADVHKYSSIPLLGGPAAYVASLAVNVFKGINSRFEIKADNIHEIGSYSLVCACNGRYYGGGFNPSRIADIDDGVLDTLICSDVALYKLPVLLGKYAKGRYDELPKYIRHITANEVEISSNDEFIVNVDGEAFNTKKLTFTMLPASLSFITPRGTKYWLDRVRNADNGSISK